MQKYGTGTTQTFSIGFQEAEFNEAPYARAVAEHLATKHTELEVTSAQALAVIPELPKIYSEPFADSSQIPTYLVAKLAREKVTVALSGDAGDELFGGYSRYRLFLKFWSAVGWLPASARERLGAIGAGFSQKSLGALGRLFGGKKVSSLGFKLHRGFEALSQPTEEALYAMLLSHWCPASEVMAGRENSYQTIPAQFEQWSLPTGMLERMMLLDTLAYLPDDILVKVDRAAMAVSLETRVPFLDHELFALAWTLPSSFRLRGSSGKWALKKLLEKFLPKSLVYRPKQGFGVPIGEWLRGPLRAWAEALLDPSRIRQQGYLNSQLIGKYWSEHINGVRDWHYLLWDVLMFQAWLEERGHG